ncbi:shikimate dehydrogenase (NADP(+)) [Methylosinus sp. C49]|uniref:shikimate dehydrogenase n=1 Tax=Methylosinus sp. C49 TaxID=2699395 RepID=UPI0013677B6D|nr:shikimate dehydrogenase [Methylosinus sp. C49]BBU62238.1 shikimate dehydrogenase (NADP(+)) [Methylosinus sp. C49]
MHGQDRFLLAGVMGWPISHSRSPKIHNYWLARYGLVGAYAPLAVEPGRLEAALRALPALNFSGCNLTIPHKEAALSIVDVLDASATRIGAINCVVVEEDGTLVGRNYDGFGFTASLRAAAPMWRADAGPAVVIGAGGAARAVIAGLIDSGAAEVRLFNRTLERAQKIAADFGAPVTAHRWEERAEGLAGAGLLVNTTNQGMVGEPPLDLALDRLPAEALVSDIVYAPLETPLLAAARARGNVAVDGLGMLIHQARPAFRDWFGVMPEATPELRALIEATL